MDNLNTYLFFNPKYRKLSKNLLFFQYKKDYNNNDIIKTFDDFYNKYPDFKPYFYMKANNLNLNDDKKLILHWLHYGIFNNFISSKNDFNNIYKKFDYNFYNNYYELNLRNEDDIIFHYLNIGKYNNYYINENILHKIYIKNITKLNKSNNTTLKKYDNTIKKICHLFVHFFKCGGGEIYFKNFIKYSEHKNYLLLNSTYDNYVENYSNVEIIYYKDKENLIELIYDNNFDIILDHQYYSFDNLYLDDKLIIPIVHNIDYYKKEINNVKYTINLYNEKKYNYSWNNIIKSVNYLGINSTNNSILIKNKLKYILKNEKFNIGNIAIIGRIDAHKINPTFIKLLVLYAKKNKYKFNIYGNIEDSYKNFFLKNISNQSNIIYKGYINYNEINDAYINNDLLISPSKSEAGATVLLEAMNNGIISICRNKGGNKETINNDKYLVNNDNEYFEKIEKIRKLNINELILDILKSKRKILFNHNNKNNFYKLYDKLNKIKIIENCDKIPNIVHYIYGLKEQDQEFPFLYYYGILSNLLINQPIQILFHYQYLPYGYWWDKIKDYLTLNYVYYSNLEFNNIKVKHYAHKSDYIRLLILYKYGGIYYDIDTLCVKSHHYLLDNNIVFGIQENFKNEKNLIGNAVIYSRKNNFFLKLLIDNYPKYFDNDDWTKASLFMITELYDNLSKSEQEEIKLLDKENFYYPNYNESYLIYEIDKDINNEIVTYHYCYNYSKLYINNIENIDYINNKNTFFSNLMKNIYNIYNNFLIDENVNYEFDNTKNIYDIIIIINCLDIINVLNKICNIKNILKFNINIFIYNNNLDKNLKLLIDDIKYFKNIKIFFIKLYKDININKKIDISKFLIENTIKEDIKITIINKNEDIDFNKITSINNTINYSENINFLSKKNYNLNNLLDIFFIKKIYK